MSTSALPLRDAQEVEVSVVIPCLNEADTLAICIRKATTAMEQNGISGEVIVADNGSTDSSIEIARREGARVVCVTTRGYGAALMGGIDAAKGAGVEKVGIVTEGMRRAAGAAPGRD